MPLPPPPNFTEVLLAHKRIRPHLPPTPLRRYPSLDELLQAEVYVKHENYQPTGAFKVRGGVNYLAQLTPEERRRGVATASTGNHGQSVAYAARLFGARAVIVAPEGANPLKVAAMRSLGAEVVLQGADFEASKVHAQTLSTQEGLRFISSGDEPWLIAGVATTTVEMLTTEPGLEVVIVPVGGGSGAAGACLAARTMCPRTRLLAVQSRQAQAAYLTWKTRAWQTASIGTIAGGLATGEPFMLPQQMLWSGLDDFLLVDDADLLRAMRLYLETARTLAEPAGAAPLAAAWKLRDQLRGQRIGLILSGGNASVDELRQCLA